MTTYETQFYKLPAILKKMEQVSGVTFRDIIDEGHADPMTYIANKIAKEHDGEGYSYGLHSDNAMKTIKDPDHVSIRLKDGHGVIVDPSDNTYFDINHRIEDLGALELILFATAVKTSLNGYFMLVRYDLLVCYANPYLKTNDSIWDFFEGIECECRSTVINLRDMSVASLPYYKFRNLGETETYDIDHVRSAIANGNGHIMATEKLDGSMIQMHYVGDSTFEDGLLVSTSGTLIGSAASADNDHIDAVIRYHLSGEERKRHLGLARAYNDYTLIFEFVRPEADRHVVFYADDKCGLYLTGMRNIFTGKLAGRFLIEEASKRFGVPIPEVLATDIDEALAIQRNGDGSVCEGMVVNIGDDGIATESGGWLVKVKLDGFLALSHIHHEIEGAAGFKGIAKMVLDNTIDDALPILPDALREYVEAVIARFEKFETEQRAVIDKLVADGLEQAGDDRKAFALYVNALAIPSHWKGWMFQSAYNGDVECFWADRKGSEWRYIAQSEFEEREAALENWAAVS